MSGVGDAPRPPRPPVLAGKSIDVYRIEVCLGEGATGVVHQAVRESDGTTVALKLLRPELAGNAAFRARFRREARAASEIRHPHLVALLDSGEWEGVPYLVVEYVSGGSLDTAIRDRGPLPPSETAAIVTDIAEGLSALHGVGLVHRDVKPSNIMLGEQGAALTDYGLAKGYAYTVLTEPGTVLGTIDYLAPELIRGEAATPASDLYALGCAAFECLVGVPPFARSSIFETLTAHLEDEPAGTPNVADEYADAYLVIRMALAKDPANRPSAATGFAQLLSAAIP